MEDKRISYHDSVVKIRVQRARLWINLWKDMNLLDCIFTDGLLIK